MPNADAPSLHTDFRDPQPGSELRWPSSALWRPGEPAVRAIGAADLWDSVVKGAGDFTAAPTHVVFLAVIYPVIGLILGRVMLGYDMLPLVYPLITGFALVGPIAAMGLYELSRRREQGLDVSVGRALDVFQSPSFGAIARLSLLLLAIFLGWLFLARSLYVSLFGVAVPASVADFANQVLTTPAGTQLIVVGNGLGFLIAVAVLTISVVSFPLLLDRKVSAATAVRTSVRAVLASPLTMALWGIFVVAALILGALPFFFGLCVVLPVLGHATWHLYRKAVSPTEVLRTG